MYYEKKRKRNKIPYIQWLQYRDCILLRLDSLFILNAVIRIGSKKKKKRKEKKRKILTLFARTLDSFTTKTNPRRKKEKSGNQLLSIN